MKLATRLPHSRILLFLAAVLLVLSAGCGSGDADEVVASTDAEAATTSSPTEASDDEDHDDEDHDDEDHDDHDNDDESSSGLGAHVHGAADLFVAWNGNDVVVDLVSPTNNIFGFEYEATSDEDLALVEARTEMLTAPGVLAFNAEAECELVDEAQTELEYDGSHAEITASWLFACANPDELTQLDAALLFAEFPGLEDVDAQWASEDGQSAAELTPSSTILRFE